MQEESSKPILTQKQLMAAICALALHAGINGAVPYLAKTAPDDATEKAVERIGNELEGIRTSLVSTQLEMSRALATTIQELNDHSRRLERLEDKRNR